MWSFWSKISGGISDGGAEPFENANFDHLENGPNLKFSSLKMIIFSKNDKIGHFCIFF